MLAQTGAVSPNGISRHFARLFQGMAFCVAAWQGWHRNQLSAFRLAPDDDRKLMRSHVHAPSGRNGLTAIAAQYSREGNYTKCFASRT